MKNYELFDVKSEELKRNVRVSVYKPKNYDESDLSYPVLYMHDGQNLFDDTKATYGKSWGIVEAFEKDPSLPEIIIVGIDSTENRSNELVPFVFYSEYDKRFSGGSSDKYYEFIIHKLKVLIDQKYRTLKEKEFTGICGSSYGGLSSIYAALKYPNTFTRFGCVSNAWFEVQKELENMINNTHEFTCKKLYMDVGTKETTSKKENKKYIASNKAIYELLSKKIDASNLKFEIIKDAIHNEAAWEIRFPEIIKFLFSE